MTVGDAAPSAAAVATANQGIETADAVNRPIAVIVAAIRVLAFLGMGRKRWKGGL